MEYAEADTPPQGVAIVGMACRFPGADSIGAFWENICNKRESVSFFTDEELLSSGVSPETLRNPNYVKARPLLENIEMFDAAFFQINPREAEITDPQHRLFLECAWEALEDAGYEPEAYKGVAGIYAGVGENQYAINLYLNRGALETVDGLQVAIGNSSDYLTTRVAYKLNLTGPSVSVQTACSTSLVAVHLACQSLLNYQSDMMLAGGVTLSTLSKAGYFYQAGGIVSPDGHCRAFDAQAQGTVFGSGVGIVVLKRLEDALADGDTIYAIIKGTAINNDGSSKIGYTAPGIKGQVAVITEAQALAQIEPETIDYIETHGTATPLGDAIEIAALKQVFAASTEKQGFCALGSVKTNIGHLDTAAGVAGLIKTALAIKHRMLPPSLHFHTPNPQLELAHSAFYINTELKPWKSGLHPRRAGVSSFGIGGTNAHVVLEEAPEYGPSPATRSWQLFMLSARTSSALESMAKRLAERLEQQPDLSLPDVAYTLQVGRKRFDHWQLFVCQDRESAINALRGTAAKSCITGNYSRQDRSVVFLFPGQGAQYVRMAAALYREEAYFREQIDCCAALLKALSGLNLREILYPQEGLYEQAAQQLKQTAVAQPALFAVEYALAKLWMQWGIQPEAMIGHSIGEYVAACLAEVFSLEDALRLIVARGNLMQQCKEGAMLAVPLPEQDVQTLLGNALSLAAINSPAQCVLSGPTAEIQTLQQYLSSLGITCQILHTSHAFHSSMMDPIIDAFISEAEHITRKPPTIPYLSNVTGTWITEEQIRDARYWATHLRQTVRFSDGLETLLQNPHTVFLEVGPGNTLCSLLKQQPHFSQERIALPSMRHPQERLSDSAVLLMALGRLWLAGIDVDWTSFYVNERRRRVSLPTYCFERQRYWIQLPESYRSDLNAGMASPDEYREPPKDLPPSPSSYLRPALQTTYAAPTNDVERRLCHMLQELLGIEKVGIHDDFFELGGHSLTAIRFLARIREVYQVDLSISSLFETTTVSGLAQQITNRLQSQEQHEAVTVEAAIDLNAEAVLAADILPTNASFEWMPEPAVLFLTGGTGFIGPVLLHELLTQTKADIYCLIRASNTDEARRRLRKQLESYTLWDESYRSRVVPVVGDLSKPFLGLAADDFHALAAKVDVIYHSGAQVNFLYPYQVLKPTNVLGTQEVIRLACSGRIKPIHYMSTVGVYDVADYAALSVIPEQAEIECSRTQNGTGYAQSKWVAERLLIGSRERGVPTTLYRAGSAGGHSKTGISNTSDVLCRLIKSCIQLELAPDIDTYLDITPVDYICRALTHLSRQKTSSNQVFHVVNPQITRWQDLVSWLISFGYPLRLISYNQWQAELVKSVDGSADNALLPLISFLAELPKEDLLRSSETSQPGISMFDTTHTRKGLSRSLIACPTVDANLISIYIAYLIRIGFLPAPEPS